MIFFIIKLICAKVQMNECPIIRDEVPIYSVVCGLRKNDINNTLCGAFYIPYLCHRTIGQL